MYPVSYWNTEKFLPLIKLLQISPTYELARLHRSGECSPSFLKLLPTDFEDVLRTYDKFGNVMETHDFLWINLVPRQHFDFEYSSSPLQTIGYIGLENELMTTEDLQKNLSRFIESRNETIDESVYQLIVFRGSEAIHTLVEHFKYHTEQGRRFSVRSGKVRIEKNTVKFSKKRLHFAKIQKGVDLLLEKVANPTLSNWRLGLRAKYSTTFERRINNSNLLIEGIKETKVEYGKIVYRAIKKFERMAENAARGKYPCDDPIDYTKFDYNAIQKRIGSYLEWVRINKFEYPDLPNFSEYESREEAFANYKIPEWRKTKFEIDTRQKELF